MIFTDLKRSASNLKPTNSATTICHHETSQCCPWQPEPRNIGADLKRCASNMKPTVSASIVFFWWNISMLSMTTNALEDLYWFKEVCFEHETNVFCSNPFVSWSVSMLSRTIKTYDNLYWFEKVCSESETNGFCSTHILILKRLNVVHDSKSLWSSVMIWKNQLRIWNQRFLQQPFSCGETFQCCAWQQKHMIIGTDLQKSASSLKPTFSAATSFL